jgi:hypothetical protein
VPVLAKMNALESIRNQKIAIQVLALNSRPGQPGPIATRSAAAEFPSKKERVLASARVKDQP